MADEPEYETREVEEPTTPSAPPAPPIRVAKPKLQGSN